MKKIFLILLLPFSIFLLPAQEIKQMEFVNQSIKDILFTLAQTTGTSIIADDTVDGNASYHFTDTDLDTALEHFLSHYDLYFWKKDGIYYVSKIKVYYNEDTKELTLYAKDAGPGLIFEKIAKEIKSTILYDALPVSKVIEIVMRRFTIYEIESLDDSIYVKRRLVERGVSPGKAVASITVATEEGPEYSESVLLSSTIPAEYSFYSIDNVGNSEIENELTIVTPIPDITPPVSALSQSYPPWQGDSMDYYKSTVEFTLSSEDILGQYDSFASGIDRVFYRTDSGTYRDYIDGSKITFTSEGLHIIYYYAADLAGNTEQVNNYYLTIDDSALVTDLVFDSDKYLEIENVLYIPESEQISLTAQDTYQE